MIYRRFDSTPGNTISIQGQVHVAVRTLLAKYGSKPSEGAITTITTTGVALHHTQNLPSSLSHVPSEEVEHACNPQSASELLPALLRAAAGSLQLNWQKRDCYSLQIQCMTDTASDEQADMGGVRCKGGVRGTPESRRGNPRGLQLIEQLLCGAGHSLGGALASMCAFDLAWSKIGCLGDKQDGDLIPITAFTFEAPRVGEPICCIVVSLTRHDESTCHCHSQPGNAPTFLPFLGNSCYFL